MSVTPDSVNKESFPKYEDRPGVEEIGDSTMEQCDCGGVLLIRRHGLRDDEDGEGVYATCPKCSEKLYL